MSSTESENRDFRNPESDKVEKVDIPLTALIALLLAVVGLAWQFWSSMKHTGQVIHTVDLAAIVKTYQNEAKQRAFTDGTTDEQRAQILQNMQQKMNAMQQTIDLYAAECACNIWVKSALVGSGSGDVLDVTQEIMQRIGKVAGNTLPPIAGTVSDVPVPKPNALSTPIDADGKIILKEQGRP